MGLSSIPTILLLALGFSALPAVARPAPVPQAPGAGTGASSYWVSSIARKGAPAFGEPGYQVFRNVRDFGAKGDGTTDDTDAINRAISEGGRCGQGCPSSTTTPAMIFFPPGQYVVSKPIIQFYYTQLVGDASNPPTLFASPGFQGMAVIDADPYDDQGNNWWINQNNFFRQVRNFVIDLTRLPPNQGAGIHWQVAQATSLQNIVFNMHQGGGEENKQLGIFMDNGSGGFMADLTFIGGHYGAFLGSQQFTTRNLTFRNCQTAIFVNWNWAWTLQDINIDGCGVGLDMANGGESQTVGSVLLLDSVISNTEVGIKTAYNPQVSATNGTLIINNVDMTVNVPAAVLSEATKSALLPGNSRISAWVQGKANNGQRPLGNNLAVQGPQETVQIPDVLLNKATGRVFTRTKPQYENVPASAFLSVKDHGAKGDGKTDDTAAIQAVFDRCTRDQIVYFDHGAYLVTDTVRVPSHIKITGEIWPLILAGGDRAFKEQTRPRPVFQVGRPGEKGAVELSELMFETAGPQPGAVMIEWNVAEESQGASGMWDVHVRIGGSAGTGLQLAQCGKAPEKAAEADPACFGAHTMLHVTPQASAYIENCWFWVADHDLEPAANNSQINVFNGRGVLLESQAPVWLWGTASEHSVLYNYQLRNASNAYLALIQTETPYFQGNPEATTPFVVDAARGDPDFSTCQGAAGCARAWGVRAVDSRDVFVFGAGLYSFFDNYAQECLDTESCQANMVSLENSAVHFFGLSTKAAVNMLTVDGQSAALDADNRNNFCATLAHFSSPAVQ